MKPSEQNDKPKSDAELMHHAYLHHAWLTIYHHYRLACWDSPMDEARKKINSSALRAVEKAIKDHEARFPDRIDKGRIEGLEKVRLALKTGYEVEAKRRDRLFKRYRPKYE